MQNIIVVVLLAFFSLYGLIEFCSMLYDKFLGHMDIRMRKYFLFIPSGDAETLEAQLRAAIDFADKSSCEPIVIFDSLWNIETQKIAETLSRDFSLEVVYKEDFLRMMGR